MLHNLHIVVVRKITSTIINISIQVPKGTAIFFLDGLAVLTISIINAPAALSGATIPAIFEIFKY